MISTLRKTVKAMGGDVRIVAEFPDRAPAVLSELSEEDHHEILSEARARSGLRFDDCSNYLNTQLDAGCSRFGYESNIELRGHATTSSTARYCVRLVLVATTLRCFGASAQGRKISIKLSRPSRSFRLTRKL